MARYSTTVRSPWPPDKAFDYVADLRNLVAWDPGVTKSVISLGSEPGKGTAYDVVASGTKLRYRTKDYSHPIRTKAVAESTLLRSVDVITVTPHGDGSDVTYDAELTLRSVFGLMNPLLQPLFNRIGDKAAAGLATAIEGEITS